MDDDRLSKFEIEKLHEFVDKIFKVVQEYLDQDISYCILAGALQAQVVELYLLDNDPDFEGLEELLKTVLNDIINRPKWDIK